MWPGPADPVQDLIDNFADLDSLVRVYPLLLQGFGLTILLSIVTLPIATVSGLAVAVAYSTAGTGVRRMLVVAIDILRAFPVLVLLVLIFYGLPFLGLRLDAFMAAVLAIALNNTGYFGEIFRAGIEAVPAGQREAAAALGLHRMRILVHVILPQAIRKVTAPLASNALELVKTTSIASLVSLPELLRSARVAQEQTYNPTPLVAASLLFFALLWPFARWVARLERRALAAGH